MSAFVFIPFFDQSPQNKEGAELWVLPGAVEDVYHPKGQTH